MDKKIIFLTKVFNQSRPIYSFHYEDKKDVIMIIEHKDIISYTTWLNRDEVWVKK